MEVYLAYLPATGGEFLWVYCIPIPKLLIQSSSLSLVCKPRRLWWTHGLLLTFSALNVLDTLLVACQVKKADTMTEQRGLGKLRVDRTVGDSS